MTHFTAPPCASSEAKKAKNITKQDDTSTRRIGEKTADELTIDDAIRYKEAGNKQIAKEQYRDAEISYSTGIEIVSVLRQRLVLSTELDGGDNNGGTASSSSGKSAADHSVEIQMKQLNLLSQTETALRSNLSLILIKQKRYDEAERHCTVALECDPDNWKVCYRRADAREHMVPADLIGAEADLNRCVASLSLVEDDGTSSASTFKMNTLKKTLGDARRKLEHVKERIIQEQQAQAQVQMQMQQRQAEQGMIAEEEEEEENVAVVSNGVPSDESTASDGPPPCPVISPFEQRKAILRLLAAVDGNNSSGSNGGVDLVPHVPIKGEAYHLISTPWWRSWCRHVDFFRDVELEEADRAMKRVGSGGAASTATGAMKEARATKAVAIKGRLAAMKLLPPGASLSAPMVRKDRDETAKKRPSTASSSSSSSEESEDDEWLAISGAFGPQPGPIDNSLLILNTDGNAGSKDAHDEFFAEWCRPSYRGCAGVAAAANENPQEDHSEFVRLRPNLVRGHHFECIPREAYGALVCWYGEVTPPICRRAAESTKNDSGEEMVRLLLYPELQHNETGGLSPTWSGGESSRVVSAPRCGACKSPGARSRCTRCLSVSYCRKECQISHWSYHKSVCKSISTSRREIDETTAAEIKSTTRIEEDSSEWGRIGLNNLGNTCFMASALQCLSHSAPLTKYFLSGRFKVDLNPDNPLGSGGKLAEAFEEVIKALWMSGARRTGSISPTGLKRAIATYAPQFGGVNQHDSHEFITYLLDALHEDLNRVRNAPYVEMPDALPGQKLTIAGAEAWDLHRRRNDSLVMDTFFGQFKSTCVCPKCQKISVSYDAFKDVSLEIPQFLITQRVIDVKLFRVAGKGTAAVPLTRYALVVEENDTVEGLTLALSQLCGISKTNLVISNIHNHSFHNIYANEGAVSHIGRQDTLYAYQVHPYGLHHIHAPVTHVVRSNGYTSNQFGVPFMTSFPSNFSCRQIWSHVWTQLRRYVISDEPDADDRKGLLQINIVDIHGTPLPIFERGSNQEGAAPEFVGATSVLPPTSDVRLVDIMGSQVIDNYLFLACEWTDIGQPFLDFDLVEEHPSYLSTHQRHEDLFSRQVTLDRCFETFTSPERLDGNNLYYCSSCKEHVRATKTMELWRLPNVLVVHLKRFEFRNALRSTKDETFVNFPLEGLDMSRYCAHPNATVPSSASASASNGGGGNKADDSDFVVDSIPAMYDLFGVVNHYGRLGFGHYTAYARRWDKNGMDKDWAVFDDSSVREFGDGTTGDGLVATSAAYVLFYRRRVFS